MSTQSAIYTATGIAFHGDLAVIPIKEMPKQVEKVSDDDGRYIVAHSETGHHHWLSSEHVQVFKPIHEDPLTCYLQVHAPSDLVHDRTWDTHQSIRIPPGTYKLRRQQEWSPEGWRRVED